MLTPTCKGLDFFINEIPNEVFTYSEDSPMTFMPHPPDPPNIYTYLLVNIGSTSTGGRVLSVKADLAKIQLTSPACTEVGEKVALSRRIEKHWRLVGKSFAAV